MSTGRLEAFSDGVLAIIITVMVLELKAPDGPYFSDLHGSATGLLTYLLSFVYIGIYWNNHHHMFQIAKTVDGIRALGQPAPAVLAVALPLHDHLDGRARRRRRRSSCTA